MPEGLVTALIGDQPLPWALVGMFVLAILFGRLIPRSAHLDRINDLKAAIAALEETVKERERQIGILMGREP